MDLDACIYFIISLLRCCLYLCVDVVGVVLNFKVMECHKGHDTHDKVRSPYLSIYVDLISIKDKMMKII